MVFDIGEIVVRKSDEEAYRVISINKIGDDELIYGLSCDELVYGRKLVKASLFKPSSKFWKTKIEVSLFSIIWMMIGAFLGGFVWRIMELVWLR